MGVLSELFAPTIEATAGSGAMPWEDWWYNAIGAPTESGETVTPETAMRLATVYACVRVLAESVAGLPLHVYRRRRGGGKDVATDHWLYYLLHDSPNDQQTSFNWRESCQGHLCLRGNAYNIIENPGTPRARLTAVNPDRVIIRRLSDGSVAYRIRDVNGGGTGTYLASEILHVPGISLDGIQGITPIAYMARGLGLTIAAEKFGARFFANGAKASGVVRYPGHLTPDGLKNLRESIQRHIASDKIHSPLVLEEDAKWDQLTVNPDEAQFLETRKFQAVEICQMFGVPPHLVGILDKATFNNIEQLSIEFVRYSLRSWLVRWEQVIDKQLLPAGGDYFVRFKVDGLLRGDVRSRYIAFGKGINDGWLLRSEAREFEDLNPVDGLDVPLVPLNMTTADKVGQGPNTRRPEAAASANRQVAAMVIADAAARIASAEIKAIGGRIDKADGDRERFVAWLQGFYHKQIGYISQNVAIAAKVTGGDADPAPAAIIRTGVSQFRQGDQAAALFAAFQQERERQIRDILTRVLLCDNIQQSPTR